MKTISRSKGLQVLNARVLVVLIFACLVSACTCVPQLRTVSFIGGHFYDDDPGFTLDLNFRLNPRTPKTILLTADQLRQLEVWFQNQDLNWKPVIVSMHVARKRLILTSTNRDEWGFSIYDSPEGLRNAVVMRQKNDTYTTRISDKSMQSLLTILRPS